MTIFRHGDYTFAFSCFLCSRHSFLPSPFKALIIHSRLDGARDSLGGCIIRTLMFSSCQIERDRATGYSIWKTANRLRGSHLSSCEFDYYFRTNPIAGYNVGNRTARCNIDRSIERRIGFKFIGPSDKPRNAREMRSTNIDSNRR